MSLHFLKIAVDFSVQIGEQQLQRHSVASPGVVGKVLATEVLNYVERQGLNYFPALGYFEQVGGVEADALAAARDLAWLSNRLAESEVRARLRAVFSAVDIQSSQPLAFTMPTVRRWAEDAPEKLAAHYTPDRIKLGLVLTLIQRHPDKAGLDRFARRTLWRWLRDHFGDIDVSQARVVE